MKKKLFLLAVFAFFTGAGNLYGQTAALPQGFVGMNAQKDNVMTHIDSMTEHKTKNIAPVHYKNIPDKNTFAVMLKNSGYILLAQIRHVKTFLSQA